MRVSQRIFFLSLLALAVGGLVASVLGQAVILAGAAMLAGLVVLCVTFFPGADSPIGKLRLTGWDQVMVVTGIGLVGGPTTFVIALGTLVYVLPTALICAGIRHYIRSTPTGTSIDFLLALTLFTAVGIFWGTMFLNRVFR